MKNPDRSNPPSRRGAALIVALAIMVLVLALVVGILSRVMTERSAAGGYASSVGARLLGDTAVQLVQAQIDAATSGGTTVAWSSQPGLIRTFDSEGRPAKSFKLYSANDMQMTGALVPATEAADLMQWHQSPAVFTDINMPVDTNFDGSPDTWPILDPSAAGVVQGFAINNAPTGKYLGVDNPAPMPVRWLYVLQDGVVVAPTGSGATATVAGATAANPIVGRIAFWTDDETCKVNVNTASEGTYWDVPKAGGQAEKNLGLYQPAKNEFQAYPGHPATASLSAVFPDFTRDQILDLVPRIQQGGSENATVDVNDAKVVSLDQNRLFANEDEVLFAEKLTANIRNENPGLTRALLERSKFFLTTTSRAPEVNLYNLPRVACWPVHEKDGAFRTPFDRLIAFCATLNGLPYYFQRKNADSTTADYAEILRNRTLFKYLRLLGRRDTPGFGGNFAAKYGDDHDQILTEMFDYIRCTNLADGNLAQANRYAVGTQVNGPSGGYFGQGQVMPIVIEDAAATPAISTRGFGRVPTITEVGIWLICTGDPDNADSNKPATNFTLSGSLTTSGTAANPVTKQIRVEAALVMEPFIPLEGYRGIQPDIEITIAGLEGWSLRGNASGDTDQPLGFPSEAEQTPNGKGRYSLSVNPLVSGGGQRPYAGHIGINAIMGAPDVSTPFYVKRQLRARNGGLLPEDAFFRTPYGGSGSVLNQQYPFVSEPVTVRVATSTASGISPSVTLNTTPLTMKVIQRATGTVLQTFHVNFPAGPMPAPTLRAEKKGGLPFYSWTLQASGNGNGFPGRFAEADGFIFQHYDANSKLCDVVRTVVPVYTKNGGKQSADLRLLAMSGTINAADFDKHPLYDDPGAAYRVVNSFTQQGTGWYYNFCRRAAENADAVAKMGKSLANMSETYDQQGHPDTSWPVVDAQANGDWDNGIVGSIDGPYLNKPDEGVTWTDANHQVPYFDSSQKETFDAATFFSPNRIIPSPGMFGSLPTGAKRGKHWQTLLFRRQPGHPEYAATAGNFTNDPDYLFLDLFWMPVVEPYAISEPLSTAGKINLNQQVVPFTWLERNTGLYAVLKNEKVMSIPNADAAIYKTTGNSYRRSINLTDTLKQLNFRFDNTDGTGLYAFRSAAEICDQHIIPDDATVSMSSKATLDDSMKNYWGSHALTGDNSRERIYTTIYPRLTTKSNTYTVYFRAQSLRKRANSDPKTWDEEKDTVTGDYQGATTLERYVAPGDSAIPDYASNPDATPSLDSFYKWRMRANRPFAP